MGKRRMDNPTTMCISLPTALKERLIRRAGVESADAGRQISVSEVVQDACEEYLDLYESATFVLATTAHVATGAKTGDELAKDTTKAANAAPAAKGAARKSKSA